jgi:hypothetical protein
MIQTFHIVPADTRVLWFAVPVALILVGVLVLLWLTAAGARSSRFEVSSQGLRIRGDLYGRRVPAAALVGEGIRQVDLRAEPDLAPKRKTVGTSLPGYRSGWFRLRDGRKALLYVTDETRVVLVPTTEGYSVLLSVREPAALAAALQRIATGHAPVEER